MYQIGDRVKAWVYSWGIRASKEPGLPDANQEAYIVSTGVDEWQGHYIPIYYLADLEGNIFRQENNFYAKEFYRPAFLGIEQLASDLDNKQKKELLVWCVDVWRQYEVELWKKKSGLI